MCGMSCRRLAPPRSARGALHLISPYKHIVRNGIGHGGITFRSGEIRYRDKKGNEGDLPR